MNQPPTLFRMSLMSMVVALFAALVNIAGCDDTTGEPSAIADVAHDSSAAPTDGATRFDSSSTPDSALSTDGSLSLDANPALDAIATDGTVDGTSPNDHGGIDGSLLPDQGPAFDAHHPFDAVRPDAAAAPVGLGAWTGMDNVPASQNPPGDLEAARVPMFVSLGWDDNAYSGLEGSGGTGGMVWATNLQMGRNNPPGVGNAATYDGTAITMSFYLTSVYAGAWMAESPTFVKRAWRMGYDLNHEIGNHTHDHHHGSAFPRAQWEIQIDTCTDWITKPFDPNEANFTPDNSMGVGVPRAEIYGFRTPFLEYNAETLAVLRARDFWYDCSIEDGWQVEHDGRNFMWPYTLDNGSPGHQVLVDWELKAPIRTYPGLWELPVHPVIVPPDDQCERYGVPIGLRARLNTLHPWFDVQSGKVTGFDYNLWVLFRMSKAEFLGTLKYTLDLRLEGNRAPLMFGTHSDYYSSKYMGAPNSTAESRREAIEEFLEYALSIDAVRVVSNKEILDWVRNPAPL